MEKQLFFHPIKKECLDVVLKAKTRFELYSKSSNDLQKYYLKPYQKLKKTRNRKKISLASSDYIGLETRSAKKKRKIYEEENRETEE